MSLHPAPSISRPINGRRSVTTTLHNRREQLYLFQTCTTNLSVVDVVQGRLLSMLLDKTCFRHCCAQPMDLKSLQPEMAAQQPQRRNIIQAILEKKKNSATRCGPPC